MASMTASLITIKILIETQGALAGVAQLVGTSSCNQKFAGSISGQGPYLGCGFSPRSQQVQPPVWNMYRRQSIEASLLHRRFSLSLPLSPKCNEKMSSGEDLKKKKDTWSVLRKLRGRHKS